MKKAVRKKPAPKPTPVRRMAVDMMSFGPEKQKLVGPRINDLAEFLAPATPPPGVLPKGRKPVVKMAMDQAGSDIVGWMAGAFYNVAFTEGWTFLGYPYLSQLAQIPEYRLISQTVAEEATRKWIEIKSVSDDEDKSDAIQELEDEMKRLGVREAFKAVSEQDGFFGRSHLYLDTGDTDKPGELVKPIGHGDEFSEKKFKPGFLRALKTIEPVWCYPARYNAADPLADDWYRPDTWFVNGKETHRTRLLKFEGHPVPDLLKPAFSFGGLSLSQMAKPYVDNWLQTRQSVNDLIQAFSTMVLKTDLSAIMQTGGAELDARIKLFNSVRNNRGVMALSKTDEDFANVAVPLGTLDKLQAQAQEHIATPAQIPIIKLFGITPTGLNATAEPEIRVWYDRVHAYQEYFFNPHLQTVFKMAQINLWGKVDQDLTYIFKPLWELDEVQQATVRKIEAETDGILMDKGALAPIESRQRLADDPEQPYGAIDVEDVPEPIEAEPGNIRERIDEDEAA